MGMAPPKRWAGRSSAEALVHSFEHAADSLFLSRETYTCPEKHTLSGAVGSGLLTAALLRFVLYEALMAMRPHSEQREPLLIVTSQG